MTVPGVPGKGALIKPWTAAVIVWRSRTASLLSNYLEGRRPGPVFVVPQQATLADCTGGAGAIRECWDEWI